MVKLYAVSSQMCSSQVMYADQHQGPSATRMQGMLIGSVVTFPLPMLGAAVGGAVGAAVADVRARDSSSRKHLVRLVQRELGEGYHVLASQTLLQMRLLVLLRLRDWDSTVSDWVYRPGLCLGEPRPGLG
jgi:hypothetical protein